MLQIRQLYIIRGWTSTCEGVVGFAVSSSPRPWMEVFALPEKYNMAVAESDPDPKVRKMTITF